MKSLVVKILLYIWQLPQNLIGLLLRAVLKGERRIKVGEIVVYYLKYFPGGISLGNTIILNSTDDFSARHEYGHCRQSLILGWLYLPVVGLFSLIHAWLYIYDPSNPNGYYRYWTEAWADKLGGVSREYTAAIRA